MRFGPDHLRQACVGSILQLVAFDCSSLFVRDSKLLTEVLDVTPPFLRNHAHAGQVVDYRNWGLSLGRRFRSLKVLFMLRSYGVSGFQAHLRRSIALTQLLEENVTKDNRFELVTPRSLALLVFRLKPASLEEDAQKLDQLNRRFYANLHKRTNIQLSTLSSISARISPRQADNYIGSLFIKLRLS